MRGQVIRNEITLNEMRERVGQLIFGVDWIGGLTDDQYDLLRAYPLIPRDILRTDGSTIRLEHVEPCPAKLAPAIDRARGKQERMGAQYVTVDSWIQDHGLPVDPRRNADRKSFDRLMEVQIEKQKPPELTPNRQRGPRPRILPRIIADMERDLVEGHLTREDLAVLPDKELAARYSAKRERVRTARAKLLNGRG
jgi:hypothetical protein